MCAAACGLAAVFATPFIAAFPPPDPPDVTDFGRGMLMLAVGFAAFTIALVPLWIFFFRRLRRRFDANAFGDERERGVRDA